MCSPPPSELAPYLPIPRVVKTGRKFHLDYDRRKSIGKIKIGLRELRPRPAGVRVRDLARRGGTHARLPPRRAQLELPRNEARGATFPGRSGTLVKHEFVLSGAPLKERGVRTLDLAKRLLDEGVHAPTIYFPSLVDESLMIELPETESKWALDEFAAAFERAVHDTPENLHAAPRNLSVSRIDEVRAARVPLLSWKDLRAATAKVETPPTVPSST